MSELDFSSLRVVITGASSGIGLGLAQSFAAAGARLVLNARDERKLHTVAKTLQGQQGLALVCGDIGVSQTADSIITAAVQHFGGADVLINNAGIFFAKPVLDYSEAEIDAFLATNWRGTVLMTQAMVRQLRKQGAGGTIIQITSSISLAPYAQVPASVPNSTKGALNTFTRSLALELAKERIRVHAVAPGIISHAAPWPGRRRIR